MNKFWISTKLIDTQGLSKILYKTTLVFQPRNIFDTIGVILTLQYLK